MTDRKPICRPYPPNAGYKTIGSVPLCVVCGNGIECWDAYLTWERSIGIYRFKVGDRVKWQSWRMMGTEPFIATGTIESVHCGVPYYTDPPVYIEYEGQTFHKEAGRHPAALIKPDREPLPGEAPIVIAFKDLTHVE